MSKNIIGYIGTYTGGDSKGIYRFSFDTEAGVVGDVWPVAELENPTYLTISRDNKHLYSVGKLGEEGGVFSYLLDKHSGDLRPINHKVFNGSSPCHINLTEDGKYLVTANYHKGSVDVFPIGGDGSIEERSYSVIHAGSGPNKERQEKPHTHFAAISPDNRKLCVIDLGIDKFAVYDFIEGTLRGNNELSLHVTPGCGPRHMDFHPNKRFAYIITELSNEIIVLEHAANDRAVVVQQILTLPEGYREESLGSAIRISSDGNYLYASNRGHDSIAVFKVDSGTGKLELVEHVPTGGEHPRDFNFDPTENFILVANKNTDNIIVFKRDKATGRLTKTSERMKVPSPVCIKFMHM